MLRGDWLWWGYGIRPAQTPNIVKGSISMWVVRGVASPSYSAICLSSQNLNQCCRLRTNQCQRNTNNIRHCYTTCSIQWLFSTRKRIRKLESIPDCCFPHWHPDTPQALHVRNRQKCENHPDFRNAHSWLTTTPLHLMCKHWYISVQLWRIPQKSKYLPHI